MASHTYLGSSRGKLSTPSLVTAQPPLSLPISALTASSRAPTSLSSWHPPLPDQPASVLPTSCLNSAIYINRKRRVYKFVAGKHLAWFAVFHAGKYKQFLKSYGIAQPMSIYTHLCVMLLPSVYVEAISIWFTVLKTKCEVHWTLSDIQCN